MGTTATVFETEVCAIDAYARHCMARNELTRKRMVIASDSPAALKAFVSMMLKSRLVLEDRRNLNKLGRRDQLKLIWVPGHSELLGNESADLLAKTDSESRFVGPEPFCGFGMGSQDSFE